MPFVARARRMIRLAAPLALLAFLPARASADLVLSVEPLTQVVAPGGTGSVEILLSNTGPSVDIATFNYQLLVDESAPLTFTGLSESTLAAPYIFGANGFGIGAVAGNDGGFSTLTVSDFLSHFVPPGAPVTLAAGGAVSLGVISFAIDPSATPQLIPISINDDIDFTFVASTNTGLITPIAINSLVSGTVQVLAVPEPSSLLLMVGTGLLTIGYRRRTARVTECDPS